MNQGGWRTTGTGHDGPAFICRIGYSGHQGGRQYPTPQQDDCVLTPPASAYWSYWHADPGQKTWTYSQLGAMLYKPKPGSVDLWIFGGTNIEGTQGRPTVTPDQLRAKNTRPTGGDKPVPQDTRTAVPLPPGVDTGPAPENPPCGRPDASPDADALSIGHDGPDRLEERLPDTVRDPVGDDGLPDGGCHAAPRWSTRHRRRTRPTTRAPGCPPSSPVPWAS